MKIQIHYEYNQYFNPKFFACSGSFSQSGSTWVEARQKLITVIKVEKDIMSAEKPENKNKVIIPEEEEVDI